MLYKLQIFFEIFGLFFEIKKQEEFLQFLLPFFLRSTQISKPRSPCEKNRWSVIEIDPRLENDRLIGEWTKRKF